MKKRNGFDLSALRVVNNLSPRGLRDIGTLVLVTAEGVVEYATGKLDKDALVGKRKPNDALLFIWPGQWRTDVFRVTTEDLGSYYYGA